MKEQLLHSITSNNSHRDYGKPNLMMVNSVIGNGSTLKQYQSNQETRRNSRDMAAGKVLNFLKDSTVTATEEASKCVYDAYLITNTSNTTGLGKQRPVGSAAFGGEPQATTTIDLTSRNGGQ
jgi:hypothetical protein